MLELYHTVTIAIFYSALVGVLLGFAAFYFFSKWLTKRSYVARAEKAIFAEKEAEELLKRRGFEIMGKQARENIVTLVDGQAHLGYVQADYLVKRKGKIFVAEVKSGDTPPDPTDPSTRRQLLEYDHVFRPDGLLLVDMKEKEIREVEFQFPREKDLGYYFQLIFISFIAAAVIGIIWLMTWLKLF